MTKIDELRLRENPVNNFICCGEQRSFRDHKTHLVEDHKLNENQLKGKKRMISHIDGDYWFSSDYEWELENGLKFTQHIMMARK